MNPGTLQRPGLDLAFTVQQGLIDPLGGEAVWAEWLGAWLGQLAPELDASLKADGYSLGLQLCDDATIADLNNRWRQRPGPTDVLAFAAQEQAPPQPAAGVGGPNGTWLELGDLVISLETAARQATAADHGLEEELLFLASHGLLHLLGWDHPDQESLDAMLERQRLLLETADKDAPAQTAPARP